MKVEIEGPVSEVVLNSLVRRWPYGFEVVEGGTVLYEVLSGNYHHASPEVLLKENQLGPLNAYNLWKEKLSCGMPEVATDSPLRETIDRLAKVGVYTPEWDSRGILLGLEPGYRCSRSRDPGATAWATLSITEYLLTGRASVPEPYFTRFKTQTTPAYYDWYRLEGHLAATWAAIIADEAPGSYAESPVGTSTTGLDALASYVDHLTRQGIAVKMRDSLVQTCIAPHHLDNPLGGEVWCRCVRPCNQGVWLYPGGGGWHRPHLYVTASHLQRVSKIERATGFFARGDVLISPDGARVGVMELDVEGGRLLTI